MRIGGVRVGIVEKIEPVQDPETGAVHAKVDLKLDKSAEPVPKDSTVVVRSRSALGLKYLEINKGTSSEGYAEGSTLPLRVAHPEPVEIDEFFNIFDPATRTAAQGNLVAFGNALAGRGPGPERGLRRAAAPGHPPGAGGSQPRLPEDRGGALLPRSRPTAPPRWRRSPRPRLRCSSRSSPPSAPSPGWRARTSRSRSRRRRPRFDTLIRTAPRIRSFLGHSATPVRRASPGHQGAERELADGGVGVRDRRRRAARRPAAERPARAHGAGRWGRSP